MGFKGNYNMCHLFRASSYIVNQKQVKHSVGINILVVSIKERDHMSDIQHTAKQPAEY